MRARPLAKRLLFPAILLLFGTCVGLALAEVGVRALDPHARDHAIPGSFAIDTAIGWRMRPGLTSTHRTRYFTATYTTNSRGYRDVERTVARTPGRTRVLVFGDSQVFGWGVPQARRFTDLLEAEHPDLEVWNLGVLGYGFDQELLEYERHGEAMNGDVVVFFATRPTLERSKSGYIYRKPKPRFVLRGPDSLELLPAERRGTALTQLAYRLLSPWYLPYFLDRRVGPALRRLTPAPAAAPESAGGDAGEPALDPLSEALLERAARIAEWRKHRLIVLTNLGGEMLAGVRRIGSERGFEVVALELPGGYPVWTFGPEDGHWTEQAHRLVADRLWEGLQRVRQPRSPLRYRARSARATTIPLSTSTWNPEARSPSTVNTMVRPGSFQ